MQGSRGRFGSVLCKVNSDFSEGRSGDFLVNIFQDACPEFDIETTEGSLQFGIKLFEEEMEQDSVCAGWRGIIVDGPVWKKEGRVVGICRQSLGNFVHEVAGLTRGIESMNVLCHG